MPPLPSFESSRYRPERTVPITEPLCICPVRRRFACSRYFRRCARGSRSRVPSRTSATKHPTSMPVEIRYYTDPACPWSWANEPEVRRLMWEFGDEVRFTWVMGGLAREYDPESTTELIVEWLGVAAESGMPIDP